MTALSICLPDRKGCLSVVARLDPTAVSLITRRECSCVTGCRQNEAHSMPYHPCAVRATLSPADCPRACPDRSKQLLTSRLAARTSPNHLFPFPLCQDQPHKLELPSYKRDLRDSC